MQHTGQADSVASVQQGAGVQGSEHAAGGEHGAPWAATTAHGAGAGVGEGPAAGQLLQHSLLGAQQHTQQLQRSFAHWHHSWQRSAAAQQVLQHISSNRELRGRKQQGPNGYGSPSLQGLLWPAHV